MLMLCYRCLSTFFVLPSSLLTLAVIKRFNFFILYFTVLKNALNLSIHWKTIYRQKSQSSIPIFILEVEEIYDFREWWERINDRPLYKVYIHKTEVHTVLNDANGLPHYIRCAHRHFLQHRRSRYYSHAVADQYMHLWYSGYCAKMLDAIIRSFHHRWPSLPKTFEYYLIQEPFGFYVVP